jgi:uncharacterized protein
LGSTIKIQACAAWPDRVVRQTLELTAASQLKDIRRLDGLDPELAQAWDQAVGFSVYGEKRTLESQLEQGDRVEILRPLRADPKEARRQRAKLKSRPV